MDMRKLISFSKGSYIVSMPKSWVEKNKLKKGDLMAINENGCEIVITPNNAEMQKENSNEIVIDANSKSIEHLKSEIVSAYLNNFNSITIVSENLNKDVLEAKEIIRSLSGLEIMEQTNKKIVAKDILNINEISIKNIIRRMDVITRAMIEEAMQCAEGHDNYDVLHNRDADINRLYFLAFRVIKNALKNPRVAKAIGAEPWGLLSDRLILVRLETIADTQKRIARYLKHVALNRDSVTELEKLHFDIGERYKDVMKAYYNNDKKLALEIETTNKEKIKQCDKFLEKCACAPKKDASMKYSAHVALAKLVENMKVMATSIKYIARNVMTYD